MKNKKLLILGLVEIIVATILILSDFLIPTLFLLVLVGASLFIRKKHLKSLGFKGEKRWVLMSVKIFGLMVLWTIFVLAVLAPLLSHLFGLQQDVSAFSDLKSNVGLLFILLAVTWTLAAVGEEIVYRGFLQTRFRELLGYRSWNYVGAVVLSSLLFGLAHTEQGLAGVVLTFFDAIYFSLIKKYFNDNLWAAVLAHGFSNTIGIVGFFILGPVRSFW